MSNETKRDVLEYYLDMIKALKDPLAAETVREARQRYAAALPDDLPTIPLAVSEEIKSSYGSLSLHDELDTVDSTSDDFSVIDYIENSESVFAEAWSRGLWIVEETGEVTSYDD